MIGLDTNVLLRLIVKDDPKQTVAAQAFLYRIEDGGETIFLSDMVLCEFVWTLKSAYKYSRQEIIQILRHLMEVEELRFESFPRFFSAVETYEQNRGDFLDYLICEKTVESCCRMVVTFDRALLNDPRFQTP